MKFGELLVDEETKKAATEYATNIAIDYEFLRGDIEDLRDAFIAGVAWKKIKDEGKDNESPCGFDSNLISW